LQVENWPFCKATDIGNPCNQAEGEFVDFAVAIKGPVAPNVTEGMEARGSDEAAYDLGGGAALVLSKLVRVDGVWKNMTEGWPKISGDGERYILAVRFPKHNTSVLYDPTINTQNNGNGNGNGQGNGNPNSGGGADNGGNKTNYGKGGTIAAAKTLPSTGSSGVTMKVLGQSGKIELSGVAGSADNAVGITMDYIREVDVLGDVVGKGGAGVKQHHALETFAPTQFAFTNQYDTTVSGIPGPNGTADVRASAFDFFVGLISDGPSSSTYLSQLTVQTVLFAENGTISPTDGEEFFKVTEGTLKFNE
jgi:hypothetical protein